MNEIGAAFPDIIHNGSSPVQIAVNGLTAGILHLDAGVLKLGSGLAHAFKGIMGGAGLDDHLEKKLGVIGARAWDKVVMHGYSTLDRDKPRDPAKLIATAKQMADFLRNNKPWSRLLGEGLRYAHAAAHVRAAVTAAGLKLAHLEAAWPRDESNVPVRGLVVVAGKA